MSLRDTQNFLARLYTDEDFRRLFEREPETVGREQGLNETEIAELAAVVPEELSFFAESLFRKRLREVEKLLPLVKEILAKDFETNFREFANQFLSNSIRKHLDDATEFCRFLERDAGASALVRDAAKMERARLEFELRARRLIFRHFDYDLKTKRKRKNFRLWLRVGKKRFVL